MENCKKCQTELVAKGTSELFKGRRDESLEICPNCYEQCPNCGNWYDKGDLSGRRDGERVCDNCNTARFCEACGAEITESYNQTHTREGHDLCNYECMSTFYADEIPESEEFICVPK